MEQRHIGCSGYYYRDWKGRFYPDDIPQSRWLEYYCTRFCTIEINASFYRFPTAKSLKSWYDKTPAGFVFAVKANQEITHFRKLHGCRELVERFSDVTASALQEKLGILLFQLPPSFSYSEENLGRVLESLRGLSCAVEFRHMSWWNDAVYKALTGQNICFCSISHPSLPDTIVKTSPIGYIRFHGKPVLYKSAYSREEIVNWDQAIRKQHFGTEYVYFNNTWGMGAIENAELLLSLGGK